MLLAYLITQNGHINLLSQLINIKTSELQIGQILTIGFITNKLSLIYLIKNNYIYKCLFVFEV